MKHHVLYCALALAPALLPFDAFAQETPHVAGLASVDDAGAAGQGEGDRTNDRSPPRAEATVSVVLDIDEAGAVTNCRVPQTSGYPELDTLTCDTMIKTARFEPGRNDKGEAIASQYRTRVTFRVN